ncbi:MAG: hypothetical protein ACRDRR_13575 [Pseudonocardiaceae bacterium]
MRKTRFLTWLAAGALVVAVATGGGLLMGGVANAAPPASSLGTVTASTLAATSTTTALTVTPGGSFPEGLPVALIAIVTPPDAEGTVQFKDANIGDPATVLKGTACSFGPNQETTVIEGTPCPLGSNQEITAAAFTITSTLTAGSHSLTAEFTPANPSAFDPSASPPVPFTVTPPILSEVSFLLESILAPILGALPGGAEGVDRVKLFESIHGGLHGDADVVDRVKLFESIHGGLHGHAEGVDRAKLLESILGGLPL